jgi:hypothetical protein
MVFIGSVTEGKKGHVDGLCAATRNSVALSASRSDWRGQQVLVRSSVVRHLGRASRAFRNSCLEIKIALAAIYDNAASNIDPREMAQMLPVNGLPGTPLGAFLLLQQDIPDVGD